MCGIAGIVSHKHQAIDVEELHEVGAAHGYQVGVTWDGEASEGELEVVFAAGDAPLGALYRPAGTFPQANRPVPFRDVAHLMKASFQGPDFKEGVVSFLKKRPAEFPPLGEGSSSSLDV